MKKNQSLIIQVNNISDPFEFGISADITDCIGNLTEFTNLCDPCYEYQKALDENFTATEITKCSLGCFDRLYYYHLQAADSATDLSDSKCSLNPWIHGPGATLKENTQ